MKRSRSKGGLAGPDGMKSVFGQVCAKMSTFGTDSLMLPHRVWKVKFIGKMGLIVHSFNERESVQKNLSFMATSVVSYEKLLRPFNGLFTQTDTDTGSYPNKEGFPLDWSSVTGVL